MNHYRNKRTGEFKDVEPDSAEQFDLQAQVGQDGRPLWEQTGAHHAQAVKIRAAHGKLNEADLGQDHQDQLVDPSLLPDAGPEVDPHLQLTPGEIEAGLTPEQKSKDLDAMFDHNKQSSRAAVLDGAADDIADERVESPESVPTGTLSARAGGTNDIAEPSSGDGGNSTDAPKRNRGKKAETQSESPAETPVEA